MALPDPTSFKSSTPKATPKTSPSGGGSLERIAKDSMTRAMAGSSVPGQGALRQAVARNQAAPASSNLLAQRARSQPGRPDTNPLKNYGMQKQTPGLNLLQNDQVSRMDTGSSLDKMSGRFAFQSTAKPGGIGQPQFELPGDSSSLSRMQSESTFRALQTSPNYRSPLDGNKGVSPGIVTQMNSADSLDRLTGESRFRATAQPGKMQTGYQLPGSNDPLDRMQSESLYRAGQLAESPALSEGHGVSGIEDPLAVAPAHYQSPTRSSSSSPPVEEEYIPGMESAFERAMRRRRESYGKFQSLNPGAGVTEWLRWRRNGS